MSYAGACLVLSVLSFGVYSNSLYGEWVFDDIVAIISNKDVLPSTPWENLWNNDFWGNSMNDWQSHKSFRPVTIASFRLSYIMAGERFDEFSFHIVNVIAHCLATVLTLPLFRALLASSGFPHHVALSASALFASHPIHTDAVSSIVSRGEPLSAIMYILSLLMYMSVSSPSRAPRGFLLEVVRHAIMLPLSAGLAFIGMLCKEMAITVVGIQVVYDLTLGFGIISATRVKLRHKVGDGDEKRDDDHGHDRMDGVDVSHCGIEGEVGKGDRCQVEGAHVRASSRSWMGFGFFTARMVFLIAAYTAMYVWRVGKNGECVTVYKVLGDPDTSAWDVAGTVAPGIYSHSSCKPNFLKSENPARWVKGPGASLTRLMTWSHIVFINARLLAMPVVLMADYSHDTVPLVTTIGDVRNVETVIFFTALLLFSGYSFAQSLRSAPACLLALSLLAAPFIPCSNLLFPVGFVVAERVLYLPSIGFCLLLAIALHSLLPPRIAPHSLALIVAAYSVRTFLRNHDWSTKERFFQAMVRDNPLGPKGHYGLGVTIHHSRDKEKAESGVWHLKEATRLQPNYYDAYSDLGAHFNAKGEYEKAAEYFEGAIQIKPEHIQGISNLGLNYLNGRNYEKAFDAYDTALQLFPDVAEFYHHLGQALLGLHMGGDALDALENVIILAPDDSSSYKHYGLAAGQLGQQEVAEMYLRNALRIRPNDVDALHNLGVCLMQQQRSGDAFPYFARAVKLNPADEKKWKGLEALRKSLAEPLA